MWYEWPYTSISILSGTDSLRVIFASAAWSLRAVCFCSSVGSAVPHLVYAALTREALSKVRMQDLKCMVAALRCVADDLRDVEMCGGRVAWRMR
jgi:hypothetical protein